MAGESQASVWPLPSFYFTLQLEDGTTASFQEVSGLEAETKVIEYRAVDGTSFSHLKMPGIKKVGNVTLRKGIFAKDSKFLDWYKQTLLNSVQRCTCVISLLDQSGSPKRVWTLNQAFPVKMSGTDFKSEGNEVAVDSMELTYETLTVSVPD